MSVRGRIPARAASALRSAIILVGAVVLAGCSDGVFSPNQTGRALLQLQPVFASVDWQSLNADINVVRMTATQLPGRSIVQRQETAVDPTAAEWQLPLDVPVNSEMEILVELINRIGSADVVVYSGRILVHVKSGGQPVAALVQVFPGPPDNLDITSLTIAPKNQSLLEGDQVQLTANVVGSANPTILWTSSDPSVLSVDANGVVRAAGLGTATIQAVAGPKSDNLTIDVGARAAAIQLTPTAVTLMSIDEEVTFSGRVVDARNAQLNLPVTYQISDASVATPVGPGRFRAKRSGSAMVTASVQQGSQTLSTSTTLKVQQTAVTLALIPGSKDFDALGETLAFNADARDAKGNAIAGAGLNWTSSDLSVASVDVNGVVTALGNGTTLIRVQSGALSAEAPVVVQQVAASLILTPNNLALNVGEAAQLRGAVLDARGHPMAVDIAWAVAVNPAVASVTSTGLVTAQQIGNATVTASYGSLSAVSTITVRLPATQVLFDRAALSLFIGDAKPVVAYLADSTGTRINTLVSYSSENPAVATVTSNGVVTGISEGQTFIVASALSFQARLRVAVLPLPPAEIRFDKTQVAIVVYGTLQINASFANAIGGPASGSPIVFTVADPTIASVSSTGLVTGLRAGQTEIIANADGLEARIPVTVAPAPVTQIILDRTQLQLWEGQSAQVNAFLADAFGQPGVGDPIVFSSENNAVASVSSTGIVTGVATGTTEIVARSQNLERRLTVTVVAIPKGDIIVYSDLNVFDESPNAPSNRLMLQNLVSFSGTGPRDSGNYVWLDYANPTNCPFCGNTFDFMLTLIKQTGMQAASITAGNGRLTQIPSSVKALFLYVPNGSFTASEISLLKAFVATGGRLVLIGGHGGSAADGPLLNELLSNLGSGLRAGTTRLGCGRDALPATSLRAHQVTAGMTDFRAGCTVELNLGPGDVGLVYDETNTVPVVAATRIDGAQN